MSVSEAAEIQNALVAEWRTHGPDYVHDRIGFLTVEELRTLLMLNIGHHAR
jgi:hypothetical protein